MKDVNGEKERGGLQTKTLINAFLCPSSPLMKSGPRSLNHEQPNQHHIIILHTHTVCICICVCMLTSCTGLLVT